MKKCFLFLFCIFSAAVFCQKKYAKEFSFTNDNDLYVSFYKDRYYTNGVFLKYRVAADSKNNKIIKKAYNYGLSHKMYAPFKATVILKEEHDRPFASYFYGNFGVDYFLKENAIFKTEIQIGTIGKNAYGKELQDFIHDIYDFEKATGWKYQIKDAIGVNLNASYIKNLWTDASKTFDINWYNNAQLGTIFTNATTGFYTRIGFAPFQELVNSIAFGGNLNNQNSNFNNEIEVFLYAKPTITYAHYDATIQGSFLNKTSPITFELENFLFDAEFGLQFTANRFNIKYAVHLYSKRVKSVRIPKMISYGIIQVNYQFN